jgi:hypothetical protein
MWWRRRREVRREELPSWLSEKLDELPSWAAEELKGQYAESEEPASAFAAAFADVRANCRGKSTAEVADELGARLAGDGFVMPREALMWHARDITEPHWPLRHPIEIIRGIRASRGVRDEDSFDNPDPFDDNEPPDDPEREALVDLLHEDPNVRGISFSSSEPDVAEVFLQPWSEASAQWVRDVCSPREVRFVDDLPQWVNEEPR